MLALENLAMPFDWCASLIQDLGLSTCLDVGHLWVEGRNVAAHVRRWRPHVRAVHLHGVCAGHDHLSLAHTSRAALQEFLADLCAPPPFRGVVTLEVFSFEDTASSINVLREEPRTTP